ncbi:MAG: HAD-IC family P-type ATPase, partial [Gammaproteobacteria bacterium]|nr:HAD-IC family P-type ATPase [Gammaproteobacteria bacterium]
QGDTGSVPLSREEREYWLARVDHQCGRGLRTIALASKTSDSTDADPYADLVLHGIACLEDPARDGVQDAIRLCRDAGVVVVMVTGDHAATASNIAAQTGIIGVSADDAGCLDGAQVDRLIAAARDAELLNTRVFSRVTPEHKLKLIDLYQRHGHVVAMTGDGVNDAPALKKADIGVAMGIRGTAVAKEAAEMVLQDDEFSTIVAAIRHGRMIFANIRKFVIYLLSCNISEVLIVSLATLAGAPLPLLPLQILFLNLVTDVFPALALGVGPGSRDLMQAQPRRSSEAILMRSHWVSIGAYGAVMALTVLGAMTIALQFLTFEREQAVTVSFCTLAFAQLWHVFNMRNNVKCIIDNEISRNLWVWIALAVCTALILAAVYVPLLGDVLRLADPGKVGWIVIGFASLVPLISAPVVAQISSQWGKEKDISADKAE